MLSLTEQTRLNELESLIRNGLEEFQRVGIALYEIKESKLYRNDYPNFNEYCLNVWGLKISRANYLSQVGSVLKSLGDGVLPEKQSYAFELSIIKSDEYRQRAWNEVCQHDRITKSLVQSTARKYTLIESESPLASHVVLGRVSVDNAWELNTLLYGEGNKKPQIPELYVKSIELYGIKENVISPLTVRKLRWLEFFYPEEVESILISGILDNGRESIPLTDLQPRDIERFKARLDWETSQSLVEVNRENQKLEVGNLILDGFNLDQLKNFNQEGLVHIFPEGVYDTKTIANLLGDLQVLYLVAYKGNPEIRFNDSTKIRVNQVNGIKPEPFMQLIKTLQ